MTSNTAINWDYSDRAATYEHRADYESKAMDRLLRHIPHPHLARAADIGAGTGKLTRPLLAAGLAVVAVEPNDKMRAIAAQIPELERPVKAAAFLFALFLTACGGGGDDPPIDEATSTIQPLNCQDKPDACR